MATDTMWELHWVVLKAPQPPASPEPTGRTGPILVPPIRRAFAGRLDSEIRGKVIEALADGWEPFDTTPLTGGDVLLWLRRATFLEPQVVEVDDDVLPGQYL